jgi:hypothetical protein
MDQSSVQNRRQISPRGTQYVYYLLVFLMTFYITVTVTVTDDL